MKLRRLQLLTPAVKMAKFESVVKMNGRNIGYLNPAVLAKLADTTNGVFSHVVLAVLDDEGAEAAIGVGSAADVEALPLMYSRTQRTARVTLTRLVRLHPVLRVPKGQFRVFPASVRTEGDKEWLVLSLKQSRVEAAARRKRRGHK
jgi:hypothetical protein